MAYDVRISNSAADAEGDALAPLFNNGYLYIYNGTRPTNANTAVSGQTLLATLRFAATGITTSTNGVLTAGTITQTGTNNNTGTASWYRCVQSDNSTVICDGEVGTTGSDMNLSSTSIVSGGTCSITSFTHTIPQL
jgi:hypothetical protein